MFGEGNEESLEAVLNQWMACDETLSSAHTSEMPR